MYNSLRNPNLIVLTRWRNFRMCRRRQVTRSHDHNICIDILQILLYRLRNHRRFLPSFARSAAGLYVFDYERDGVVVHIDIITTITRCTRAIDCSRRGCFSRHAAASTYTPVRTVFGRLYLMLAVRSKLKNRTSVFLCNYHDTDKRASKLHTRIPRPRYRLKLSAHGNDNVMNDPCKSYNIP